MQDLTQTHQLLRPLWGLLTAGAQNIASLPSSALILPPRLFLLLISSTSLVFQPLLSPISPLLHFDDFKSDLSLTGPISRKHKRAQTIIFPSARCHCGYFTAPDRITASPVLSRKYQRFMFDIYDPAPGGLPQTEQPMRKSRLESVSNRLSCTFAVTIMQMSSQPGFHPCSFYFRCKTQPSRGEPADELDCPPWLFFYWSHTSVCVVSVKVCRQMCFKRLWGPRQKGPGPRPQTFHYLHPPPTFHFIRTAHTDNPQNTLNLKEH